MELQGLPAVTAKLRALAERYPRAAAAALYQEGFDLWNLAARRAPVKHGVLRGSAYVAPPEDRAGADAVVEVGFGTVYARRQHEETTWKHPRGGEAKYLWNALQQQRSGMLVRLAERIRDNVDRGVGVTALAAPTRPNVRTVAARKGARSAARALRRRQRRRR